MPTHSSPVHARPSTPTLSVGILCFWLFCAAPATAAADVTDNRHAITRQLETFIDRAAQHGFSGSAIVAIDDETLLHTAHGPASMDRTPLATDTRFDIGSIAKQFTAAAILRLQMEGRLSVDDPVTKFFPDLTPAPGFESLTIHQLLTHTSGISRSISFRNVDLESREATVRHILQSTPDRMHSIPQYANPNYFLLAAIIEVVAEEPFEAAMRRLIFEPAGMRNTMFCQEEPSGDNPRISAVLEYAGGRGTAGIPTSERGPANMAPFAWGHKGATGVLTTTGDLHAWHLALRSGSVLDEDARRLFLAAHYSSYGYGWIIRRGRPDTLVAHHGGRTVGFESFYTFCASAAGVSLGEAGLHQIEPPKGLMIALLSNRRRGTLSSLSDQLMRIASGMHVEPPPEPGRLTAADWRAIDELLGTYEDDRGRRFTLARDRQSLILTIPHHDSLTLWNPPDDDTSQYDERLKEILRGWMTGDEGDLQEYAESFHPLVPPHVAPAYTSRWSARPGNPLLSITPLGTTRQGTGGEPESYIRLEYQNQTEILRIFWRDERIYGIGEADAAPARTALEAESQVSFASLQQSTWQTVRIVFGTHEGQATVTIRSDVGEITALRVP